MNSGRHKLSENVRSVWFKMSYSHKIRRDVTVTHVDDGQQTDDGRTEREDRARIP